MNTEPRLTTPPINTDPRPTFVRGGGEFICVYLCSSVVSDSAVVSRHRLRERSERCTLRVGELARQCTDVVMTRALEMRTLAARDELDGERRLGRVLQLDFDV